MLKIENICWKKKVYGRCRKLEKLGYQKLMRFPKGTSLKGHWSYAIKKLSGESAGPMFTTTSTSSSQSVVVVGTKNKHPQLFVNHVSQHVLLYIPRCRRREWREMRSSHRVQSMMLPVFDRQTFFMLVGGVENTDVYLTNCVSKLYKTAQT